MLEAVDIKRTILIDCDPGIDDALAILLALSEKSFSVEAITTESGNVGVEETTRNLINILGLAGIKRLPKIGKGSAAPLSGKPIEARSVHGKDGLGEAKIDLPKKRDLKIYDGVDLIISDVTSARVDTIIATAPLTNLAKALRKEPKLTSGIKDAYIMGGALRVPGNVTKFAEFNFFCDPEAAKIVFDSGIPVTLVSLDVTQKVILKEKDLAPFKSIRTALSGFIQHVAEYSMNFHRKARGIEGAYVHDALTVGLAIDRTIGEFENLSLDVTLSGEEKGRLVMKKGAPNARFCRKVNSGKFLDLFLKRLQIMAEGGN